MELEKNFDISAAQCGLYNGISFTADPILFDVGTVLASLDAKDTKFNISFSCKLMVFSESEEPLDILYEGVEHMIPSLFPDKLKEALLNRQTDQYEILSGGNRLYIHTSAFDRSGKKIRTSVEPFSSDIENQSPERLAEQLSLAAEKCYNDIADGLVITNTFCQKNIYKLGSSLEALPDGFIIAAMNTADRYGNQVLTKLCITADSGKKTLEVRGICIDKAHKPLTNTFKESYLHNLSQTDSSTVYEQLMASANSIYETVKPVNKVVTIHHAGAFWEIYGDKAIAVQKILDAGSSKEFHLLKKGGEPMLSFAESIKNECCKKIEAEGYTIVEKVLEKAENDIYKTTKENEYAAFL